MITNRFTIALALLAAAVPFALADDPHNGPENKSGFVRVGGEKVTGDRDSSKLQEFELLPSQAFAEFALHWDQAGNYFDFTGTKLFIKDQSATLTIGHRNGFRLSLFTDANPRWFSNTASTLWSYQGFGTIYDTPGYPLNGIGAGIFAVNPNIRSVTAVDTPGVFAPLTDFQNAFMPVDLQYWRRTVGGDLGLPIIDGLDFRARYTDEHRSGRRPLDMATSFTNGPTILEIAAPVEYKTKNGSVGLEYVRKSFFVSADASFSRFHDDIPYVFVQNPNRLTDSAEGGGPANYLGTLPPSNRAYTVDVSGGISLPMRHRLTVSFSTGEMRDNELLLPWYTSNAALLATVPDPRVWDVTKRLDGKIDTTLIYARLTGDPIPLFGYQVSYRSYKWDNKTPVWAFPNIVVGDTEPVTDETDSEPFDWKRERIRAEVHVRPVDWIQVGVDYAHDKNDHRFRETEQTKVDSWTGFADFTFSHKVSAHVSYTDQKQKQEACEFPGCAPDEENPLLRRFDVAKRNSKLYMVAVSIMPTEALTLGVTAQQAKNEFPDTVLGLTDNKYRMWGLDANYAMGERFMIYANYANEKYDWDQASQYGTPTDLLNPLNDWAAQTRDKEHTYALGVKGDAIPKKLQLSADVTHTKGTMDQACLFVPGGANGGNCLFNGVQYSGWPTVETKFTWIKTRAYYTVHKNFGIGGEYWKYKFEGQDWQTDIMNNFMGQFDPSTVHNPANPDVTGVATSVFLGARVPNYDANIFRLYLDLLW